MNKGISIVWLIIAGVILIAGSAYWYYVDDLKPYLDKNGIACTQEAKLCPDGSYVSRTGPNCEFAECPTEDVLDKERLCGSQPPILCEPAGDMKLDCIEGKWQCVRVEIQSQPLR